MTAHLDALDAKPAVLRCTPGPLPGGPPAVPAQDNAPLADLLLTPEGTHDPAHSLTAILVFRAVDDRFGKHLSWGLWKCQCDRCSDDAPLK
eukprot:9486860-Pyramimonas_sp.AAC.1